MRPGADLVGPRRHADDAERTRRAADECADLGEQRDVRGVQRAQQEHHRVDPRHTVFGDEQPQGALGHVAGQRRGAGGVDDRGVDQLGGGPLHVEVDDVVGVEAGEVERQRPVAGVTGDGHVGPAPAAVIRRHLGGGPVAEPGDDAGRLGGVGWRDVLADERVDQRRLARLERARQRDADGLVQSLADPVQLVVQVGAIAVRGVGTVRLDGAAKDRAHPIARAHGVTSLGTAA